MNRTSIMHFQFVFLLCLLTLVLSTSTVLAHSIPGTAGEISEYPIPTAQSGPLGITAGADGNLWFTETGANQIGRISPIGSITEYPIPTAYSFPIRIALGSDGNLWFTEEDRNKISKITSQ